MRAILVLGIFAILLVALTIFVGISTATAIVTASVVLSSGETTPDGKLTLLVTTNAGGAQTILLRNNGMFPIIVDEFRLSPSTSLHCQGRSMNILPDTKRYLCTVPALTDMGTPLPFALRQAGAPTASPRPTIGRATLEVLVTWHEAKPNAHPTPTPTPSTSATSS